MKKINLSYCFVFLATICFIFTGCSFYEDDGSGDGGYSSFGAFINDIQVVSKGQGEETGTYAFEMLTTLTNQILLGLENEYGQFSLQAISRSSADTHLNAVAQDNWKWKVSSISPTEQQEIQNYLQYQFSMILLGKEPLTFTSKDFADFEYVQRKESGEFSEENLKSLANEFSHIGFFYYELDNLAEFVLKEVIGEEIVTRDLIKFLDQNNNQTFDYVEKYLDSGIETTKNIIKSYSSTFEKEESKSRNGVWNRIEWGSMNNPPTIIDDDIESAQNQNQGDVIKSFEIAGERALTLTEVEETAIAYVKKLTTNTALQQEELLKFKQQNSPDLATADYSGFKNYANTIYYLFYSSMENFTFLHEGDENVTVIENVLTMTHKPNLTKQIISAIDLSYNEEQENHYNLPLDNYKSAIITSNKLCGTSMFWLTFKSGLENQDLEIDVNIRYQFSNDAYREFIGSYFGESRLVESNLMTVNIPAGDEVERIVMLSINYETLQGLQDKGMKVTEEDISPLAKLGVYNVVLNKYVPYEYGEFEKNDIFHYKEGYIANLSPTFQGSTFNYQNSMSDFIELVFVVKGNYATEPQFTFTMQWM